MPVYCLKIRLKVAGELNPHFMAKPAMVNWLAAGLANLDLNSSTR